MPDDPGRSLSNLSWLRWIAIGWWIGELAIFVLRHQPEALPRRLS